MTASKNPVHEPAPDTADMTVEVLLVDDNEQYLNILAADLEDEGDFTTIKALDATEALFKLRESSSIDCVIADYRMPEIDGLQLLERVREERPALPFILLTGMGSEDIASQAIRSGVSDYFRKDPKTNEVPILARRVKQAVEQARLRSQLRESEERYRTIMEEVSEGIAIVQDGQITYCNDRLIELSEHSRDRLYDESFVELLIPDEGRSAVAEALDSADDTDDLEAFNEGKLYTATGKLLDIEYSVRSITYEEEPATMLSIRNVTAKKIRERNLERERELNRTVQRVLIESRTRADLEEEIVSLLYADGYDLVWVGEIIGDAIQPKAKRGRTGYLDELSLSTDDTHSAEPAIWTARTDEPQFPGDFEEMFSTHWRDQALEHDLRTGAALPLVYDNVSYGVLGVYHHDPHQLDEQETQLLAELSTTFAFAIHHIELKKSLSTSDVVDVELALPNAEYYLRDLISDRSLVTTDAEITVVGTHRYDNDIVLQYLDVTGIDLERFGEVVAEHPSIDEFQLIQEGEGATRVQMSLLDDPPELILTRYGGVVNRSTVTPGRTVLRFSLPSRGDLQNVIGALEEAHGSVTIRSVVDVERQDSSIDLQPMIQLAKLTDKQAAALQAAYHHGYFDQPRQQSAKDIAESLGVVHSTFLQHLRTAQRKLFGTLYQQDGQSVRG